MVSCVLQCIIDKHVFCCGRCLKEESKTGTNKLNLTTARKNVIGGEARRAKIPTPLSSQAAVLVLPPPGLMLSPGLLNTLPCPLSALATLHIVALVNPPMPRAFLAGTLLPTAIQWTPSLTLHDIQLVWLLLLLAGSAGRLRQRSGNCTQLPSFAGFHGFQDPTQLQFSIATEKTRDRHRHRHGATLTPIMSSPAHQLLPLLLCQPALVLGEQAAGQADQPHCIRRGELGRPCNEGEAGYKSTMFVVLYYRLPTEKA